MTQAAAGPVGAARDAGHDGAQPRRGAVRLSSGLIYIPGSFASSEEHAELARAAGEQPSVRDPHAR
jgi:hypothetical protein